MKDDSELLRQYTSGGSNAAFDTLVRRYIDMVYAVALRRVGGAAHHAQDVTQAVFTALARKAKALSDHAVLSAWLFKSTHYEAANLMRTERRRQNREQEAQLLHDLLRSSDPPIDGDALRALIDELIADLGDSDREAVMLRFFHGMDFAGIGERLALTADGARSRVDRALDKLHAGLLRRGVTSTAAALGMALGKQITQAAPAGLATSIISAAGVGTAATSAAASVGAAAVTLGFAKTAVVAGIALLAALMVGTSIYTRSRQERQSASAEASKTITIEPPASVTLVDTVGPAQSSSLNTSDPAVAAADELMEKHPSLRALLTTSAAAHISTRFYPLYVEQGLSPDQIAKFERIMMSGFAPLTVTSGGRSAKFMAFPAVSDDERELQLRQVLGDGGYSRFQEYITGGIDETMQVVAALTFTSSPISQTQGQQLATLFRETPAPRGQDDSAMEAYWSRLFTRAERILSPAQMSPLRAMRAKDGLSREMNAAIAARRDADPSLASTTSGELQRNEHGTNANVQNLALAERRAEIATEYALMTDAARSTEARDRLITALLEREELRYDIESIRKSRRLPGASPEITASLESAESRFASEIRDIPGVAEYKVWKAYEESLEARRYLASVAAVATLSGLPFTRAQLEELTGALIDASPVKSSTGKPDVKAADWISVDTAAASILSPEQLELFSMVDAPMDHVRNSKFVREVYVLFNWR